MARKSRSIAIVEGVGSDGRAYRAADERARGAGRREYRAAGALVYTKHTPAVRILTIQGEVDPDTGETLTVATSSARNEVGRFFRIWRGDGGRWRCRCACYSAISSCVHTGYLMRLDAGDDDEEETD